MIGKGIGRIAAVGLLLTLVLGIFSIRFPEWTRGIDSSFIVYGQSGPPLPPPGAVAVTRVIPQIPVGSFDGNASRYKTVIQLLNEGNTAATISGNFYNTDGTDSTLVLTTDLDSLPTIRGSFSSVSVPSNGILIITAGSSPEFVLNWARIVSTGGSVSISAYFDLTNGAGTLLYSRVGVPSSDANMARFTIPRVRDVDAGLDVGFAIVNTGDSSASLNATLRSSAGATLATKSLTLPAKGHTAAFAKDFFGLTGETRGTSYSFIAFQSASAQFAATALAIEGGSLSSFPVNNPASGGTGTAATEIPDGSVTAAKIAAGAVTADKVAAGQVVKSLNSLKDDVTLAAGTNITITPSGNTLTIAATGGTSGTGSGLALPFSGTAAVASGGAFTVTNTALAGAAIDGISGNGGPAVRGTANGARGIGVQGLAKGTSPGVSGAGGDSSGAGVFGSGGNPDGTGVWGLGSGNGVGVYGQARGTGAGVVGVAGSGNLAGEFLGDVTVSRKTTTASLQVASNGTPFSRIQAGQADLGPVIDTFTPASLSFSSGSEAVVTGTFTINFPQPFSAPPKVIANVRVPLSSASFGSTTVSVSTTAFTVNIRKFDNVNYGLPTVSGLHIFVDWMAWE